MNEMPAPAPGWRERMSILDGNALSGALDELFADDASALVVVCAACAASGPLAETVVEADDAASIVRCRSCTHTLMTLQRTEAGVVLRVEHLASLART